MKIEKKLTGFCMLNTILNTVFTQLYQYQGGIVLPVDHIPGHSQHAGDPSATHHPATHKQGSDTDCLESKNCTNIKINWLDKILESKHKYQGFL